MPVLLNYTILKFTSIQYSPPPLPHWPEENAKYSAFSTFKAEFCTKNKNSLPIRIGDENWSRTYRNRLEKLGFSLAEELFLFWRSPKFGQKTDRKTNQNLGKVVCSSGLRNVQSVQMHRGPPTSGGPPHLTYRAQKNLIMKNYSKL